MYLFRRSRQLNPAQARKAVAVAIEAGKRASDICGLNISVWTTVMSRDVGLISWASTVEHLSDVETATDKLATDGPFNDFIEENDAVFVGPVSDMLAQIVSGAADPGGELPAYAATVQATCANGHLADGMAAGVELAAEATRIGGLTTMFLATATGDYGGVAWITGAPDLAALEASEARVNSDSGFVALADRVTHAYLPHGTMTIRRRLS
jgi:hypothetical protein